MERAADVRRAVRKKERTDVDVLALFVEEKQNMLCVCLCLCVSCIIVRSDSAI